MTDGPKNFKDHPELKEGEVFLRNIDHTVSEYDPKAGLYEFRNMAFTDNDKRYGILRNFAEIGWTTKRLGWVAYDIAGGIIEGMRPVFVQRSELEARGINPDDLFKLDLQATKDALKDMSIETE